jgi:hypothetical protein
VCHKYINYYPTYFHDKVEIAYLYIRFNSGCAGWDNLNWIYFSIFNKLWILVLGIRNPNIILPKKILVNNYVIFVIFKKRSLLLYGLISCIIIN